jgi:hypothetical protein
MRLLSLLSLALPLVVSSLPLDNGPTSLRASSDQYSAPIAGRYLPADLRDPHVVSGKQQQLFLFATTASGNDIAYYSSSTGGRVRPFLPLRLRGDADALTGLGYRRYRLSSRSSWSGEEVLGPERTSPRTERLLRQQDGDLHSVLRCDDR